jgi:hypothetical protein
MKKIIRKSIIISIVLAILVCLSGCAKKTSSFKIEKVEVKVYKNYSLDDLKSEIASSETDYEYFFEPDQEFTEDMGPYYRFFVQATPSFYTNGGQSYMVKDLGEYPENWMFLLNPFGISSRNCFLTFYQGDLSDEEVEKALRSVQFVYVYKDDEGKNCEHEFSIDDSAIFEYNE